MNRLPGSRAVCGKTARDRTGEACGPYVVRRPVGDNPLSSDSWWLGCPLCGFETARDSHGMSLIKRKVKACKSCRGHAFREPPCSA